MRILPCTLVIAGAFASAAAGQMRQTPVKVEQGIGDTDPSRTSLRQLQSDLRSPIGFDTVYRFDRTDAFGRKERSFMRIDGATYAVFPRSTYRETSAGTAAEIPAGTTFYIGGLPREWNRSANAAKPESTSLIKMGLDNRVTTQIDARSTQAQPRERKAEPRAPITPDPQTAARLKERTRPLSIFEDESTRQQRLRDLLDQQPIVKQPIRER